jgi:hypothetical protein
VFSSLPIPLVGARPTNWCCDRLVRARDLLAKAARRLRAARGVVDWEHAGDGRLPVLDLLQLIATLPRNGSGVIATVTGRLLPWPGRAGMRRCGATVRRSVST